jgi:hypothetical protein
VKAFLSGVHGSGPDDVWITATDYYLHWDGLVWTKTDKTGSGSLWGPFALAPDDVWMGAGPQLQHWDGARWTLIPETPTLRDQYGFIAFGANALYSFGDVGTIFRWDGAAWQSESPEPTNPQHLGKAWVESDDSIWVAGDYGTIRHFNGTLWEDLPTPTLAQLFAIAGVAGDDIWAAGEAGTTLHFDGASWEQVPSGTDIDIRALWADPEGTVIAAAGTFASGATIYDGTILRWSGSEWTLDPTPNVPTLTGLWGLSSEDLWAVGDGTAIHFDGNSWSESPLDTRSLLLGVWGTSPSSIWAVGHDQTSVFGGAIQYFDGKSWTKQTLPGASTLLAVGGNSEAVWAVGADGAIWRRAISGQ